MTHQFKPGCYLYAVFPDSTDEADPTCYRKHGEAQQKVRRLLGALPETKIFVHRAWTLDELKHKRADALKRSARKDRKPSEKR